jgi:glycerol kinase
VLSEGLKTAGLTHEDLAALGITNQRETTVVWNKETGEPYYNAIVWQDTRTDRIASALERDGHGDTIRHKAGIPPATYFSGGKIKWILDNVDGVREAAEEGRALFGNTDAWLLWHLTGGKDGGVHVTEPTNASRTMLMDLETLEWDDELLEIFDIPRAMLPEIKPSSCPECYGTTLVDGPLGGEVKLTGILGDQQAATVGQVCFAPGEAKNTYGTGNFMLLNTGTEMVRSESGLLTTVGYKFGDEPTVYCLEGSIAVTGSAVQWLRDQIGIISDASESEELARQVEDNGDMYFVPAFSGLFAPYWRSDARGAIVGLSRFNTKAHLARATLESICWQSRDVAEAMAKDSGVELEVLKVDGGVTANDLCMQIQADVLGVPVSRPVVAETTALGAAYAAGLAVGFWKDTDELRENWNEEKRWDPQWDDEQRATGYAGWQKAVSKTLDWVDVD